MKNRGLIIIAVLISDIFFITKVIAQDKRDLQYFRTPGFNGINRFETKKESIDTTFEGVKVRVGGDFAMQFQSIQHSTGSGDSLEILGNNFNLPTANLNLDVQLADGVRMSMVTYLSSRHHNEAWVKGGHIQIDKLDFIKKDFLKSLMEVITLKMGLDEINYGDAHFRRSDNARAIYNPFVGNYIMDAFSTEAFGELYFQKQGWLIMGGVSNGKLNQTVVKSSSEPKPSLYAKGGFDKQLNSSLRVRITGSLYNSPGYDNGQYLYNGDRTGARYYNVMQLKNKQDDFRSGRFSPGFSKFTAFQINPFLKWKGLEFFGVYELVEGDRNKLITGGSYTQMGAEIIYRFCKSEKIYFGARYNSVTGRDGSNSDKRSIDRINIGGGWFLTDNVMVKAEYVQQNYSGNGWFGSAFYNGMFNGFVAEAVIGF